MNFGKWIVVAFVLFAFFIGTLVTVCVRQDVNLVSKEYYKEELAYQHQIERISNTGALTDKPSMSKISNAVLEITFKQPIDRAELKLFCPADPKLDKSYQINRLENHRQRFDLSSMHKGMYRARLFWTTGGKEYFLEDVIYIR